MGGGTAMTLNEYQQKAMRTCMGSCDNISYMLLNLVGEVGEFAGKIAKGIRNERVYIGGVEPNCMLGTFYPGEYDELQKEAGDILWQLAGLCKVMGWDLEDIARMNLDKLASRMQRGVIDGNGDNR